MKATDIGKRRKAKRIWDKEKLTGLRCSAEVAEIRVLLRLAISDYLEENDLEGAIDTLKQFAEDNNDRYHWPLVQLCHIYEFLGDYDKALKLITDVLYHYDRCQLAQFYFASVLYRRGQEHDAIEIWENIVKLGAAKVAHAKCDCGEGYEWAENVVADCKCSLGVAYMAMGRDDEAKYWFEQYGMDRGRGRTGLLNWVADDEE